MERSVKMPDIYMIRDAVTPIAKSYGIKKDLFIWVLCEGNGKRKQ